MYQPNCKREIVSIEQAVYCRVIGQGEDLVLLHGWGVNSAVWLPIIEKLSSHFRLFIVDLPGFGLSQSLPEYSLQTITDAILEVVPNSAAWCGWSLGGLIATYAASVYPDRVSKLIQVCCSLKFVKEGDWYGVESTVFDDFKSALVRNKEKTLSRFINLQAVGVPTARQDAQLFKKLLSGTEDSESAALLAGLDLLNKSDLRPLFTQLKRPCLSLFGQFDTLVPQQTAFNMQALLPCSQQQCFEKSSHAPFITEPDKFSAVLINFIKS